MIKAAVIGAGHFAYRVHIPVLAARAEVALDSVCRHGAAELEMIRSEFDFAFATENWREILERDIDIAIIATPHHLHFEQAQAFLQKGCHVLVEKPMCLDPREAWTLVDTAKRARRELVVSYGWHYKPGLAEARRLLARIGTIEHVLCHMASFTRSVFTGDGSVPNWKQTRIQPQAETWQSASNGGGFAFGQLSHALGILFWISDLRAASVRSIAGTAMNGIDLHDAALTRFTNGATGVLSGSCGVPPGHGFELQLRWYGEHGSMLLDIETEKMILKLPGGASEIVHVDPGSWKYSCEGPANALVDLALGSGVNHSSGEVGARAVETLAALVGSARAGGEERLIDNQE